MIKTRQSSKEIRPKKPIFVKERPEEVISKPKKLTTVNDDPKIGVANVKEENIDDSSFYNEDKENYDDFDESLSVVGSAMTQYIKDIIKIPLLTKEEEVDLFNRIDEAGVRDKIIEANLRLVVSVARRYNNNSIPIEDLVGAGNIGLMRAIELFDVTRGVAFSTYAIHWIKQAIIRYKQNNGDMIRKPSHVMEKILKIKKAERAFLLDNCRLPTDEELSGIIELSVDEIKNIKAIKDNPVSLDVPIGEDDSETTLGDMIPSDDKYNVSSIVEKEALVGLLEEIIDNTLNEKEKIVIIHRFGLFGEQVYSLEQIGEEYGISRERIRQIEERALRKLKVSKNSRKLSGYVPDELMRNRFGGAIRSLSARGAGSRLEHNNHRHIPARTPA